MSSQIEQGLVQKNEAYSGSFNKGHLDAPPVKKYAIVTCMDARIDPAAAFGIELGDAHVIRNAGGNATDAIRSLIISQQMLGTEEILVIKHTACGMLTFKNGDAHSVVQKNLGEQAGAAVQDLDFQPFSDLEAAVKEDVQLLQSHAAIKDSKISGWIYDVTTGKVRSA